MAEGDSTEGNGSISAGDLQAAAGRLRHVAPPERGGVATAPDPLLAAMAQAIDRFGPIPGREQSSDFSDAEWDDAPRGATPPAPAHAPPSSTPSVTTPAEPPGAFAPPEASPEAPAPEASLDDVLQQRLADRRRALIGDDELEPAEWDKPDFSDIADRVSDAIADRDAAGLPPGSPPPEELDVAAALAARSAAGMPPLPPAPPPRDDISAAPPRPATPPPVPPRDDVSAAPARPTTPPPVPPRNDISPPLGADSPQKLPLLTDEENKTYAVQLAHQRTGLQKFDQFLGSRPENTIDRTTNAMTTEVVMNRGAIMNLAYGLNQIEKQNLPPAQQQTEIVKLLGKAADYDNTVGRLEARIDRITVGRDPGPDLPLASRAEYESYADRGEKLRGILVQANRALDPKSPNRPDEAMTKQIMQLANANSYMLGVPSQLKNIEKSDLEPGIRSEVVSKTLAPMSEIDKRIDGMQKQLGDLSVANLGDRAPKPLPGLSPGQQAEFADRTARMRGMLNHLDRMMDTKNEKQPDAAMKAQTLELLNANRYMYNVPSDLKAIDAENLDPAAKQAKIDKLMAPMQVVDKRMDGMAKSINDFYVGKDKVVEKLPGVSMEQSKEFAERNERMDSMLKNLDRMHDPKALIAPNASIEKGTMELLRANTYMKDVPRQLKEIESQNIDPAAKQALIDKTMAPMTEIDKRMGQMDKQMVSHTADLDAAEKRGVFGRAYDRLKEYGAQAINAVKSIPDRISAQFSSDTPAAVPPPTPSTPTPAHLTVQMGADEQHTFAKGVGFQSGGIVEKVEHKDGLATVHYKAGGHEQVIKLDEKAPGNAPGQKNPLVEAVDHLKPGDSFDIKISRDANKNEIALVNDKTDNFKAIVHDNGKIEQSIQAPTAPAPKLGR